MTLEGKSQWYDGLLYGLFWDPLEGPHRRRIASFIPDNSTVLDVCCGTGRLSRDLASRCKEVKGVDLSQSMLNYCRKQTQKGDFPGLDFVYGDATRLEEVVDREYGYAVISLALHEMPPEERHNTLRSMSRVAETLIISDHSAPQPNTLLGRLTTVMERRIGGSNNFSVFTEFVESGGILGALDRCGLSPVDQAFDKHGIRHVVKATRG